MRLAQRGKLRQCGFTLIELMMVLVIVAVLATIALPAYQDYVIKANRGAAQAYLLEAAQKQQIYYNDARRYTDDPNDLGLLEPDRVADNYNIVFAVDPNTPPTYIITATPNNARQQKDGPLTIDNTGQKQRDGQPW